MTELLPGSFTVNPVRLPYNLTSTVTGIQGNIPVFASQDAVPFRFSPNMQHFVGRNFMDGILAPSIMAIGQSLTEPEVRSTHFYSRCVLLITFPV